MSNYKKENLFIMIALMLRDYKTYSDIAKETKLSERTVIRNIDTIRNMIDTGELYPLVLLDKKRVIGGIKRRFKLEVKL